MIIAIVIGVSCLFWIIAAILFVCAKGVDRRISESKKDCVEKFSSKAISFTVSDVLSNNRLASAITICTTQKEAVCPVTCFTMSEK